MLGMPEARRTGRTVMSSPYRVFAIVLTLAGCGSAELFRTYPAVESASVEAAPWPRLADGPTRRATIAAAPDPADGAAVAAGLGAEAEAARARAAGLAGPVVDVAALRAAAAAQTARAAAAP
jgi:hypothetical protein